jgi:hypothetical protein
MDDISAERTEQIRNLAVQGATDRDICEFLGMDEMEFVEKFCEILIPARAQRRISLRKKQTAAAIEGNASILMLLGKHELGQTSTSARADNPWPEPQLDPKVG